MGFSIAQYAALRPTLWHLTHSQNLELIRKTGLLMPAKHLTSAGLDCPRRGMQVTPGIPVLKTKSFSTRNALNSKQVTQWQIFSLTFTIAYSFGRVGRIAQLDPVEMRYTVIASLTF